MGEWIILFLLVDSLLTYRRVGCCRGGGGYLRVANQDSQNIVSFRILGANGMLGDRVTTEIAGVCPAVMTQPRVLGDAKQQRVAVL